MNHKLTNINIHTNPEPTATTSTTPTTSPTPTPSKKRHLRRQTDLGLVTGPGPSFLLSHEDPVALQALRQSIQDKLGAKSPIELVMAEFATADAWRGLRAHRLLGASVDTEVYEQTAAVDREYEEIDPTSRTALVYHNAGLARVLRQFERTIHECYRNIRQVFPMRAGKSNG